MKSVSIFISGKYFMLYTVFGWSTTSCHLQYIEQQCFCQQQQRQPQQKSSENFESNTE